MSSNAQRAGISSLESPLYGTAKLEALERACHTAERGQPIGDCAVVAG